MQEWKCISPSCCGEPLLEQNGGDAATAVFVGADSRDGGSLGVEDAWDTGSSLENHYLLLPTT